MKHKRLDHEMEDLIYDSIFFILLHYMNRRHWQLQLDAPALRHYVGGPDLYPTQPVVIYTLVCLHHYISAMFLSDHIWKGIILPRAESFVKLKILQIAECFTR